MTPHIRHPEDSSGGALFQAELLVRPGKYVVRSHVHPRQEKRFVVLEGTYGWTIGRETDVAGPGETLVCPPGVPHSQWNAGDTPMRIYYEHRPGLTSAEVFFETQFGLSREGKLTASGDIRLLQAAVLVREVGDFIRPASPADLGPGSDVSTAGAAGSGAGVPGALPPLCRRLRPAVSRWKDADG